MRSIDLKKNFSIFAFKCILLTILYVVVYPFLKFKIIIDNPEALSQEFYALICLVVAIIFFVYPFERIVLKYISIVITTVIFITGLANVSLAMSLIDIIDKKFMIFDNLYLIANNPDLKSAEQYINYSKYILLYVFTLLLFSYGIYSVALYFINIVCSKFKFYKGIKKFLIENYTYYLNDLTILLVIFGFIPLIVELITFENIPSFPKGGKGDVSSFLNQNIFVVFLSLIIPYTFLLNNSPKKDVKKT